jgi:hypothetical protein
MKNTIVVLFFLLLALTGYTQTETKINVPKKVKDKVLFLFPHTVDEPVTWSKEGMNYKASLTAWEMPANAILDSLGNVLSMEKRLHEKYLPPKVKENLLKEYPDCIILMVFEITNAKGEKSYKTKVQIKTDFLFDSKGTLIKDPKSKS